MTDPMPAIFFGHGNLLKALRENPLAPYFSAKAARVNSEPGAQR